MSLMKIKTIWRLYTHKRIRFLRIRLWNASVKNGRVRDSACPIYELETDPFLIPRINFSFCYCSAAVCVHYSCESWWRKTNNVNILGWTITKGKKNSQNINGHKNGRRFVFTQLRIKLAGFIYSMRNLRMRYGCV